jgi:hypothetical protein
MDSLSVTRTGGPSAFKIFKFGSGNMAKWKTCVLGRSCQCAIDYLLVFISDDEAMQPLVNHLSLL